jgi:hypothetical protein
VFDVPQAEQAHRLLEEVALLGGVLRPAHERDRVGPVDRDLAPPTFSVAIQDSSRVFRSFWAILSIAASQVISSQWSLPGAR